MSSRCHRVKGQHLPASPLAPRCGASLCRSLLGVAGLPGDLCCTVCICSKVLSGWEVWGGRSEIQA